MTRRQQRGQVILMVYIVLVLFLSGAVTMTYSTRRGPDRLIIQVLRFGWEAFLCLWLYRGGLFPRVFLVLTLGSGGLLFLFGIRSIPIQDLLIFGIFALATAVYLSFAVVLMFSPSVRAFFAYQRGEAENSPVRE